MYRSIYAYIYIYIYIYIDVLRPDSEVRMPECMSDAMPSCMHATYVVRVRQMCVLAHAMVTRVGGSALWARTPLKAACLNEARSLVDQPEPSPWQFVAPDERIHAIIVCG